MVSVIDLLIRFFNFLFKREIIATIFLAVVAVFLFFSVIAMHPFGHPELQYSEGKGELEIINPKMDEYIIGGVNETTGEPYGTQSETGANNGVTSVVFDYRGFDTLGEATVLFTAVAGVMILFRRNKK